MTNARSSNTRSSNAKSSVNVSAAKVGMSQRQTGPNMEAGPTRFPWPPVLFLASIALAGFAGALFPMPWPTSQFADILFAIGGIGIVGACLLYVSTFRALRIAKTTYSPMQPATALVTTGPFSFTRNPIYLANTMIVLSLALLLGNGWFLIFGLLGAIAVTYLAIIPEEKHLALRFAKRFPDYQRRVRRWI